MPISSSTRAILAVSIDCIPSGVPNAEDGPAPALAPATGRETREYLGDRATEARARAAEAAAKGRDAFNQGRDTLTTAIERGREAYQQARRDNA